jgi:hypothetical protein
VGKHLVFPLAAVLVVGWAAQPPLEAQQVSTSWSQDALEVDSNPPTLRPIGAQAQLACPDCDPPKRFWQAFGQLMVVQLIPWSVNRFVRDLEFARVGPESWWTNMTNPWLWDNNEFLNNQFSHPYHGSLYFNAGRSNGYSFWESMLWSGGGSLMWELYGESWAPAPNDWFNTTLGGISLGEMLFRTSTLTLDNTATGSERAFREIGATLLNPNLGFTRLVHGQMGAVNANPPDWRPGRIQAAIDVGYRSAGRKGGSETLDQTFAELLLVYGDQVEDIDGKPFSTFRLNVGLASNQEPQRALTTLTARGNLAAWRLSEGPKSLTMIGAFMNYEFNSSPTLEFGGQGFSLGPVARWGDPYGFRVQAEVLVDFMPTTALRSDYFETLEGRDYDYGVGFGTTARLRILWEGRAGIIVRGRYLYSPTVSGFPGGSSQAALGIQGRGYLWGRIGAGVSATAYHRASWYRDFPNVSADGWEVRAFGSYAIPRWLP